MSDFAPLWYWVREREAIRVNFDLAQDRALGEIRALYSLVTKETGVAIDFSDVPNILCETDKYLRVKNGEGVPRAKYVPERGG
jgi:cell division GTPase FtsZ